MVDTNSVFVYDRDYIDIIECGFERIKIILKDFLIRITRGKNRRLCDRACNVLQILISLLRFKMNIDENTGCTEKQGKCHDQNDLRAEEQLLYVVQGVGFRFTLPYFLCMLIHSLYAFQFLTKISKVL